MNNFRITLTLQLWLICSVFLSIPFFFYITYDRQWQKLDMNVSDTVIVTLQFGLDAVPTELGMAGLAGSVAETNVYYTHCILSVY